jgi:predicted P-loop ATPase
MLNVGELTAHLKAIDPTAANFLLYALDHGEQGGCVHRSIDTAKMKAAIAWASDQQRAGRSVYVTAQAMRGQRRLNSEVSRFRVVFADLDDGMPRFPRELEPSLVVQTSDADGERFQAQWFLSPAGEQLGEDDWRGIMRRLSTEWGADPNAAKPAQGLRLAGTLNMKPGRARYRVRVVHQSDRTFAAAQILCMFPPVPEPEPEYASSQYAAGEQRATLSSVMEKRHRRYFEIGFASHLSRLSAMAKGSGRNDATYKSACRWGRYVHHGIASRQELIDGYVKACRANGLAKEDSEKACVTTIHRGIDKAAHDRLEDLPDRARQSGGTKAAANGVPHSSSRHDNKERPSQEAVDWPDVNARTGAINARSQQNIRHFLALAETRLTYNAFTHQTSAIVKGEAVALTDEVIRRLWLEADALGLSPTKEFFEEVLLDQAQRCSIHPVRDYLDNLMWDKRPRLDRWLTTYLGAATSPLHSAFGRKHLIAAVRRIRRPGHKHDACLVLEGPQGAGKSTAIRMLAGEEWFTDALGIGEDAKGVIEQTSGAWLVELAELSGIRHREVEQVKTMISRQSDRARLAYGRHAANRQRQFVLFGTVNESRYLRDSSGNRRFWPVRVGTVDLAALARDRDQIWAEAAHLELKGESTELARELWELAAAAQKERMVEDPWLELLAPAFEGLVGCIQTTAIWKKLGVEGHRQDGNLGRRLTAVMADLKFEKARRRLHGKLEYCYANTEETLWVLTG